MDFDNHFGAIARTHERIGAEKLVTTMLGNQVSMQDVSRQCNLPLSTVKDIATKYKVENTI